MESTRLTINLRKQKPANKVVSFEDYCRHMDGEGQLDVSEAVLSHNIRRQGLRRKLELLCLGLEACVCIAALLFLLSMALRFFAR